MQQQPLGRDCCGELLERGFERGVRVDAFGRGLSPGDHPEVVAAELVPQPARSPGLVAFLAGQDRLDRLGAGGRGAAQPALPLGAVELLADGSCRVRVREQPGRAQLGGRRQLCGIARAGADLREQPAPDQLVTETVVAQQRRDRDAASHP